MSKPKLKPCPFCKSKAVMYDVGELYAEERFSAYCPVCLIYFSRASKEEAVEAWNRRVESTKEIEIAIGNDSPFTTADLLLKLADATDILLHQHNYDGHGYELIQQVQTTARQRAGELKNNLSGWIPVSERLPENNQDVLATLDYEGHRYVNKITFYKNNGLKITAWMPLPEPFEVGKQLKR